MELLHYLALFALTTVLLQDLASPLTIYYNKTNPSQSNSVRFPRFSNSDSALVRNPTPIPISDNTLAKESNGWIPIYYPERNKDHSEITGKEQGRTRTGQELKGLHRISETELSQEVAIKNRENEAIVKAAKESKASKKDEMDGNMEKILEKFSWRIGSMLEKAVVEAAKKINATAHRRGSPTAEATHQADDEPPNGKSRVRNVTDLRRVIAGSGRIDPRIGGSSSIESGDGSEQNARGNTKVRLGSGLEGDVGFENSFRAPRFGNDETFENNERSNLEAIKKLEQKEKVLDGTIRNDTTEFAESNQGKGIRIAKSVAEKNQQIENSGISKFIIPLGPGGILIEESSTPKPKQPNLNIHKKFVQKYDDNLESSSSKVNVLKYTFDYETPPDSGVNTVGDHSKFIPRNQIKPIESFVKDIREKYKDLYKIKEDKINLEEDQSDEVKSDRRTILLQNVSPLGPYIAADFENEEKRNFTGDDKKSHNEKLTFNPRIAKSIEPRGSFNTFDELISSSKLGYGYGHGHGYGNGYDYGPIHGYGRDHGHGYGYNHGYGLGHSNYGHGHNLPDHPPSDPFVALLLSHYGRYLPGSYGLRTAYRNLYSYLAANNPHNEGPRGAYKVYEDAEG